MPVVTIEWLAGRSDVQKAAVAAKVTEAVAEIGRVEAAGISVIFVDIDRADWAIGGMLQSEGP